MEKVKLLNVLTKQNFQHCCDQWKKQMKRYVARGRESRYLISLLKKIGKIKTITHIKNQKRH